MRIGRTQLKIAVPRNNVAREELDAKVKELTGYGARAMRDLLAEANVLASTVARALHPLLAESHDLGELAVKIAAAGVSEVRAEVVKLYDRAAGSSGAAVSGSAVDQDSETQERPDGEEQA